MKIQVSGRCEGFCLGVSWGPQFSVIPVQFETPMSTTWLRAADCPVLQPQAEDVDPGALRLVQRLLELALSRQGSEDLPKVLLEEIGGVVRAEQAAVVEASPEWEVRWQVQRRPGKTEPFPKSLLAEVLDREAAVSQAPTGNHPALLAACLSYIDRPNRVLFLSRPREKFASEELHFAAVAGHYLGLALEQNRGWEKMRQQVQRLDALLAIGRHLAEQRETVPLLEKIAEESARLLRCERATIFRWEKNRQELVGRPALGLPNNELRIPEKTGVVGKVVQTGKPVQVDDCRQDPSWNPGVDQTTGFNTRNLLCVPLLDGAGQCLGALEVMNGPGTFSAEDTETLQALARHAAAALTNVEEREALVRSNDQLEGQVRQGVQLVGKSPALTALRGTIERVARTELPVLVLGESGTGKDVVARSIHYSSPRHKQPYIPVNCAAIAETLLESELFGHEKGAFTGAQSTRQGKFEAASGGTLFLDEIGDLSAGGQAKLLRVLEEKVVYRVGGTVGIPVDTRIVAATNRNLADSVRAGKFREDLFYRLTVVTLDLPPLRDRREDILVLSEYFMEQFCRQAGRKHLKLAAEAKKRLEQHDWPGNVRELRNLLERVAYLCPHDKVEVGDLGIILRPGTGEGSAFSELGLAEATDAFQREHIARAIARAQKNMTDAARLLGLHRPNLYRKMRMLGLPTP